MLATELSPARAQAAMDALGNYYEKIKGQGAELEAFLRNALSYALLHEHTQGSQRPRKWVLWSNDQQLIAGYSARKAFEATVSTNEHAPWEHSAFFKTWETGLGQMLEKIPPVDLALEMLRDFHAQQVQYCEPLLELHALIDLNGSFDEQEDFDKELIAQTGAYLVDLDAKAKDIHQTEHSLFSADCPIQVKFKMGLLRCLGDNLEQHLASLKRQILGTKALMEAFPNKIVGFDLVMPEDSPSLEWYLEPQLKLVAELSHLFPSITLHAGELNEASGAQMHTIKRALPLALKYTERAQNVTLGHCVSIVHNDPTVAKEFAKRNMTLVSLPVSNQKILGITPKQHPLPYMLKWIPATQVCISTDDSGVSCAGVAKNYLYAIEALGASASWDWLRTCVLASFERSQLTGESLFEAREGYYWLKTEWPTEGEKVQHGRRFCEHLVKMAVAYELIPDESE